MVTESSELIWSNQQVLTDPSVFDIPAACKNIKAASGGCKMSYKLR
jgi:hypothetical protein